MKAVRKVSDKGQITIPIELRELMEIHEGDIIEFEIVAVHHPEKKKPAKRGRGTDRTPSATRGATA